MAKYPGDYEVEQRGFAEESFNCEEFRRADMAGLEWKIHPEMQWPEIEVEVT